MHPRGAALVTAGMDTRHAGLRPPLPARLVEGLAETYFSDEGAMAYSLSR